MCELYNRDHEPDQQLLFIILKNQILAKHKHVKPWINYRLLTHVEHNMYLKLT